MASMSSSTLNSIPLSSSSSLSAPSIRAFSETNFHFHQTRNHHSNFTVKAQTLDFTGFGAPIFGGGFGSDDDLITPGNGFTTAVEDKPQPECPPGLRQYETMVVLRPDLSEDERLALTQKCEELLVAGGGMYVEVFNRGIIPLSYDIQKKNKEGETNSYMDGIYLLFTYFTKPESIIALEKMLLADDNVIRSTTFKIRKRKE